MFGILCGQKRQAARALVRPCVVIAINPLSADAIEAGVDGTERLTVSQAVRRGMQTCQFVRRGMETALHAACVKKYLELLPQRAHITLDRPSKSNTANFFVIDRAESVLHPLVVGLNDKSGSLVLKGSDNNGVQANVFPAGALLKDRCVRVRRTCNISSDVAANIVRRLQAADHVVPLHLERSLPVQTLIERDLRRIASSWCPKCDSLFVNGIRSHDCKLSATVVARHAEASASGTVGEMLRETVERLGAAHFGVELSRVEKYLNMVENRSNLCLELGPSGPLTLFVMDKKRPTLSPLVLGVNDDVADLHPFRGDPSAGITVSKFEHKCDWPILKRNWRMRTVHFQHLKTIPPRLVEDVARRMIAAGSVVPIRRTQKILTLEGLIKRDLRTIASTGRKTFLSETLRDGDRAADDPSAESDAMESDMLETDILESDMLLAKLLWHTGNEHGWERFGHGRHVVAEYMRLLKYRSSLPLEANLRRSLMNVFCVDSSGERVERLIVGVNDGILDLRWKAPRIVTRLVLPEKDFLPKQAVEVKHLDGIHPTVVLDVVRRLDAAGKILPVAREEALPLIQLLRRDLRCLQKLDVQGTACVRPDALMEPAVVHVTVEPDLAVSVQSPDEAMEVEESLPVWRPWM